MPHSSHLRRLPLLLAALFCALPSPAFDYAGHRMINELALASLPKDYPAFVREATAAERIAFLAGEPD
ncbi:MAG TPA: S1/P1 Nuclease, partial [Verrucomicrobiae bacterium]|nr:S1/P1 Nuclease [Verrucomicrobiae bacterium]